MSLRGHERRLKIVARLTAFHDAGCRLRVANAEMLSLTARRRLVLSRTGRSRHDCPEVGYAALRDSWQNGQETCRIRRSRPGADFDVRDETLYKAAIPESSRLTPACNGGSNV